MFLYIPILLVLFFSGCAADPPDNYYYGGPIILLDADTGTDFSGGTDTGTSSYSDTETATETETDPYIQEDCWRGGKGVDFRVENTVDLQDLRTFSCVIGNVEIFPVAEVLDLSNLKHVSGNLIVRGDDEAIVKSIDLSNLVEVGGYFRVISHQVLETIQIGNLISAYQFYVTGNPLISSLSLLSFSHTEDRLVLTNMPALETISAPNFSRVGGAVLIIVTGLTSFSGFAALDSVELDLTISNNPNLPTCTICTWLEGVDVDGTIMVSDNFDDGCACP